MFAGEVECSTNVHGVFHRVLPQHLPLGHICHLCDRFSMKTPSMPSIQVMKYSNLQRYVPFVRCTP